MISFTKKIWKDRSAGAVQGVDPAVEAAELNRIEAGINDVVVAVNSIRIANVTLGADAPSLDLANLDLSPYLVVRMFAILRHAGAGAGASGGFWERATMRFNDDATYNNYTWEVINSDASHVNNTDAGYAAGIEAGHMTANASPLNAWGQNAYDFILPAGAQNKAVIISAATMLNDFSNVHSALGTHGCGYWNSTDPITKISLLANEGGNLKAGSRAILLGFF